MSRAIVQSAAGVEEILRAKARALAAPPRQRGADERTLKVVEFRLAKERYAVEQRHVREVFPLKELTPLACTPAFLPGIVNVRGQILPVIDIKKFFDLPETGITDLHLAVIIHERDMEVGLLADAVSGVRAIRLESIQASLPTLTGVRAQYLRGVSDDQTVILDARQILADPKLVINEQVET
jgi:purine-binding chemotaxis protein CheW